MREMLERENGVEPKPPVGDPWAEYARPDALEGPVHEGLSRKRREFESARVDAKTLRAFGNGYWTSALDRAKARNMSEDAVRELADWAVRRFLADGAALAGARFDAGFEGVMGRFGFRNEDFALEAEVGALRCLSLGHADGARAFVERFGLSEAFLRDERSIGMAREGVMRSLDIERLLAADELLSDIDPEWKAHRAEIARPQVERLAISAIAKGDIRRAEWLTGHFGMALADLRVPALRSAVDLRASRVDPQLEAVSSAFAFTEEERAEIDRRAIVQLFEGPFNRIDEVKAYAKSLGIGKAELKPLAEQAVRAAMGREGGLDRAQELVEAFGLGKERMRLLALERLAGLFRADRLDQAEIEARGHGVSEKELKALIKEEVMRRFAAGEIEKGVRFAERTKLGKETLESEDIQEAVRHGIMRRR